MPSRRLGVAGLWGADLLKQLFKIEKTLSRFNEYEQTDYKFQPRRAVAFEDLRDGARRFKDHF